MLLIVVRFNVVRKRVTLAYLSTVTMPEGYKGRVRIFQNPLVQYYGQIMCIVIIELRKHRNLLVPSSRLYTKCLLLSVQFHCYTVILIR